MPVLQTGKLKFREITSLKLYKKKNWTQPSNSGLFNIIQVITEFISPKKKVLGMWENKVNSIFSQSKHICFHSMNTVY